MAQSVLDTLTGVSLDTPTVQYLLESQTLITEVEQSAMDQDEEDIFQCGKCKCQFTSLHMFILHKQEHLKVHEQTVDLSQYLVSNDSQVIQTENDCPGEIQYNPQESFIQADNLGEPIILEEADMLFSMDHQGTSYLTSDSGFSIPIILSSDSMETLETSITNSERKMIDEKSDVHLSLQCDIPQESVTPETHESVPVENSNASQNNNTNNTSQIQNFKHKCSYCNKQFAKKFYWQQHERSHTGEKPYQCVVCGRGFAQKSNVKKHMSSHKVWPGMAIRSLPPEAPPDGSIDRTYHCQFCKEIFDSYKALKGHLIMSHLTLKVYKCVQSSCNEMFAELEEFLKHTRSHKRSEYRCHVCGDVFNTLSDLGLHQYTHSVHNETTTEKYYCCTICKSSFSNVEALQHHTETTSHDYVCPHCGKSFLIERFLRRHLKTHTTSARFTCEDCGKSFKTEQYLSNHKLIHSEETPFSCPQCPAKFKRKDRLGRHMLIHDLTKRLKCPFRGYSGCMREFSRADKLKRHLLTHSNVKRFNCTNCNHNFHRAHALKHHEMSKHVIKCDVCSQICKSKEQLLIHNCNQLIETKRHTSSQLPKKVFGTVKSKYPTPKKQNILLKTANGLTDKENLKADEVQKKVTTEILQVDSNDNDESWMTMRTKIDATVEVPYLICIESNHGIDAYSNQENCKESI